MIDIHIHTKYSDRDKTVKKILKMCKEKNRVILQNDGNYEKMCIIIADVQILTDNAN